MVQRKKTKKKLFKIKTNSMLDEIGVFGDKFKLPVYLVGGGVRDMLLGIENWDWDLTVEGSPELLINSFAKTKNAKITAHRQFGTFVVTFPDGNHIDFVTARKEVYPEPGDLPVVEFSNIKDDLFRRDFTINAIALSLNQSRHGELVDYYGGIEDLRSGVLKILHIKSFRDDPTRIFRLARFAGRGFKIEKNTEKQVLKDYKYISCLSKDRIREEFLAILAEKTACRSLKYLEDWKILKKFFKGISIKGIEKKLDQSSSPAEKFYILISRFSASKQKMIAESLNLSNKFKNEMKSFLNSSKKKQVLTGKDLVEMGYQPGVIFKKILNYINSQQNITRRKAEKMVFDKFHKKIIE